MRILLIEDEKNLALSLKKALASESYAVDVCFDGESGYEQALTESYDLIIVDWTLPKMDGLSICKCLRAEKLDVPLLFLTAKDMGKDKVMGLDAGADDYLVKPFDFDELLARMRALLRRGQVVPETKFVVDNLTVDPTAKTVKRAQKELKLRAKEYALVEYLARNAGRVVSKSQIIEHVWDSALDPFSNVVDVYIGYIRNKIDRDFAREDYRPLVQTVKGLGYCLKV